MASGNELYRTLDNILAASPCETPGFSELVQVAPIALPNYVFSARQGRIEEFKRFFATAASIFFEAVNGRHSPQLLRLLLNDVPTCYAADFHRALLECPANFVPEGMRQTGMRGA